MAHLLADETLADILDRHLHVTDEAFESRDPYASAGDSGWCSSSQVLLVCKRWLRVATPALYDVIILRSAAQAQSLAKALKKTPDLGKFVRKVRLEGGFGLAVQKFLALAPNVTDLVLNLAFWSNDSTAGICNALPSMNPHNLVLVQFGTEHRLETRHHDRENKQERNLRRALEASLPLWTNLSRLALEDIRLSDDVLPQLPSLGDSPLRIPNLRELHVHITRYSGFRYSAIKALAVRRCVLQVVLHTCKRKEGGGYLRALNVLDQACKADPQVAEKISIQDESEPEDATPCSFDLRRRFALDVPESVGPRSHPDFVPLQSAAPDVQERIWALILSEAVHDEFLQFRKPEMEWMLALGSTTRDLLYDPQKLCYAATYMLVCKRFLRLVRPLICSHLHLRKRAHIAQVAGFLTADPALPHLVETLRLGVDPFWGTNEFSAGPLTESEQADLVSILRSAPRLREFKMSCHISAAAWQALPETVTKVSTSGPFNACTDLEPLPRTTFAPLRMLQMLDWSDACTAFDAPPSGDLPQLHTLVLRRATDSFLSFLGKMSLPALRRLEYRDRRSELQGLETFLKTHGHKVTTVYIEKETPAFLFALCPNLTRLELYTADARMLEGTHDTLEVLAFDMVCMGTDVSTFKAFFQAFDATAFPALREFHIREPQAAPDGRWPTESHALAKSPWTAWGEMLHAHGVALVHARAGPWRPRLQSLKRIHAGRRARDDSEDVWMVPG
ncbi:hypothetical protein AURDEDRAFT_159582 [Auricularia subglabra TFB-10046 SS5]|nr:hypothetical protein AURDEDRAFT_159582 [Auricularia subglabra TFB-10046 SS5]